jgi:hypothetical protein
MGKTHMTAATQPADTDRADVRTILVGGIRLGVVTTLGVAAFALLSRALSGGAETAFQVAMVLAGGVVFSYVPSVAVRPRTVDGIAWAAMVGLLGSLAFTVLDTALLRPLNLYHWTWDAIGGGSGFWYVPVWWMGSAVLAWLGALVVATAGRRGGATSPLANGALTAALALILFGAAAGTGLLPLHAAAAALAFAVALVLHAVLLAVTPRR